MRNTKVYIAGKITGYSNYEKEFDKLATKLSNNRYVVINPAMLPIGMKKPDYMRICLPMIDSCDVVIFMGNHTYSNGANLEKSYCHYIEKPYIILNDTNDTALYWSWRDK